MLIPKISSYTFNVKKYQTMNKNVSFVGNKSSNVDNNCLQYDADFFKNCDGYKTIMTYNEVVSLKNLAEKTKVQDAPDNLAVMFIGDAVGDVILATSQKDMLEGSATWVDVTDYDKA